MDCSAEQECLVLEIQEGHNLPLADQVSEEVLIEGVGGNSYTLGVRSPRRLGEASGVKVSRSAGSADQQLLITFDGPPGTYVRREVIVPMLAR